MKIKEKKVAKDINTDLISPLTLEVLFRFLQLNPEMKLSELTNYLNSKRTENVKAVPLKIKKQQKPESKKNFFIVRG
jgi:hypothetical protein